MAPVSITVSLHPGKMAPSFFHKPNIDTITCFLGFVSPICGIEVRDACSATVGGSNLAMSPNQFQVPINKLHVAKMSAKPDLKITRIELDQRPELRSQIVNTLKGTRYFANVSEEILEYVLRESRLVRLRPGDTLIAESSDNIDSFYFLLSG